MASLHIVKKTLPGKVSVRKTDLLPCPADSFKSEDNVLLRGPTRRICLVCKSKSSAYACPRCSTPYCSAVCYKGHNQECTEGFYRHHVEEVIRLRQAEEVGAGIPPGGKAAKLATINALRRVRLQADETEAFCSGVGGDRLEELWARKDSLDLEALTREEQRAFLASVANGDLSRDIEIWTPWWTQGGVSEGGQPLVRVERDGLGSYGGNSQGGKGGATSDRPIDFTSLHEELQRLKKRMGFPVQRPFLTSSVSPHLPYHLLDILFAYTCVLRTYNGACGLVPEDAADDLLALSPVLRYRPRTGAEAGLVRLESARGALASSLEALRRWQLLQGPAPCASSTGMSSSLAMGLAAGRDVVLLLEHKVKTQAALVDACRLMRAALREALAQGAPKEEIEGQEKPGGEVDELHSLTEKLRQLASGKTAEDLGKEGRAKARHGGKRWLRAWHKLRFFLEWSCSWDGEHHEDGQEVVGRAFRTKFEQALHEHELLLVRGEV